MKITTNNKSTITDNKPLLQPKRSKKLEQILSFLQMGFGNSNDPVVAVIRLEGVIGQVSSLKQGLNIKDLNKIIEKAFKFDRLDAICLSINSPGGSPVQSELICKRITSMAVKRDVPVYSFVEDVAASGGYWLACAGDKIFASKSSIIGSIGVISSSFGFTEAIKKIGVERRVYNQGDNKSIMDPFLPTKAADVKIIKAMQENVHEHFIEHVKSRRGNRLTQTDDILFHGEFWTGKTALDYGLIDGIDDMYSFIHKNYGENTKFEYIEQKTSWFKKKLGLGANISTNVISEEFASNLASSLIEEAENRIESSRFNLK
jgi:signal peptide peptidase SppA